MFWPIFPRGTLYRLLDGTNHVHPTNYSGPSLQLSNLNDASSPCIVSICHVMLPDSFGRLPQVIIAAVKLFIIRH